MCDTIKLKEVIDEQQKEIEWAVISRGKYRFKDEFSHLTVNETSWFKMSKEKRQSHLSHFDFGCLQFKVM